MQSAGNVGESYAISAKDLTQVLIQIYPNTIGGILNFRKDCIPGLPWMNL